MICVIALLFRVDVKNDEKPISNNQDWVLCGNKQTLATCE